MRAKLTLFFIILLFLSITEASVSVLTIKGKGTINLDCQGTLNMNVDGTVQIVFNNPPNDLKITVSDSKKKVPELDDFSKGVSFSGKIEFSKEAKFMLSVNGTIISFRLEGEADGNVSGAGSYSINGKDYELKKEGATINMREKIRGGGTTM